MNQPRYSKKFELIITITLALVAAMTTASAQTGKRAWNLDQDPVGKMPSGFTSALTGQGTIGQWSVLKDDSAPSPPNVLAQTSTDPTDYRFPLAIADDTKYKDLALSVKFKTISGKVDQGAGLVFRLKDKDNYYIVRANAIENNVVLYKVEKGKRTELPLMGKGRTYGEKVKVPSGEWGTLRVVSKGDHFETFLNGSKLFDVVDKTFPDAGKVGLWTKADSYTLFDDLTISVPGK